MKTSSITLIVAIIALLVGGGLYLYDQKANQDKSAISSISDSFDANPDESARGSSPTPERITLTSGSEATGISNRVYSNNEFILTISASLPELDEGTFYHGWMEKGGEAVPLGRMEGDGDTYYLEYKSNTDMSSFKHIFVEKENGSGVVSGDKVLEGQF